MNIELEANDAALFSEEGEELDTWTLEETNYADGAWVASCDGDNG